MTSQNNQLVIDKIKSGELFTDEYQDACRQRKAAVLLERSKRAKQDNDFYTKLWKKTKPSARLAMLVHMQAKNLVSLWGISRLRGYLLPDGRNAP